MGLFGGGSWCVFVMVLRRRVGLTRIYAERLVMDKILSFGRISG